MEHSATSPQPSTEDTSHIQIEADLLKAAQNGDLDAFDDLQRRLEPMIKRFVRRLTGATNIEDDIVQDVFMSLYMNMSKIDPPEKLRPYVYRMARNRCYDEFRRWERRQELSLDDEPTQMWVSFNQQSERPDELTHWLLLLMEVQDAMQELPENQREALILFSEEQLSYAEIADVTNTSLGTVKSRIYHAKQNLRRIVHPDTLKAIESEW